jgi:hypothetical protein
MNCKSSHTFENWAHTLKFKPQRFCEPESEADVVAIVRTRSQRGERSARKVRGTVGQISSSPTER